MGRAIKRETVDPNAQRNALQAKWDRDEDRIARRAILAAQMAQHVTRVHEREYPTAI